MDWFHVAQIAPGTWQIAEPIGKIEPRFGVATVNMFLAAGRARAALIDTGMGIGDLHATVRELIDLPILVCNTHYHWDHSAGNHQFEQIAIHQVEADMLAQPQSLQGIREQMAKPVVAAILPRGFDAENYHYAPTRATMTLCDTDKIDLGGRVLHVLHTPGHSPGHLAYFDEANGMLFSGDTAYRGPLYACFNGSDPAAFQRSVHQLAQMANRVQCIAPGHNEVLNGGEFLRALADAVDAAIAEKTPSQPPDDFIGGREFRFGAFSLWLPSVNE